MAIDLLWAMERDDEAVALCADGRRTLSPTSSQGRRSSGPIWHRVRAEARRQKAERARREQELSRLMAAARKALDDRRDDRAVEICREMLGRAPPDRRPLDGRVCTSVGSGGSMSPSSSTDAWRISSRRMPPGRSGSRSLGHDAAAGGTVAEEPRTGRGWHRRRSRSDCIPGMEKRPPLRRHRRRAGRGRASPPSSSRSTGRS